MELHNIIPIMPLLGLPYLEYDNVNPTIVKSMMLRSSMFALEKVYNRANIKYCAVFVLNVYKSVFSWYVCQVEYHQSRLFLTFFWCFLCGGTPRSQTEDTPCLQCGNHQWMWTQCQKMYVRDLAYFDSHTVFIKVCDTPHKVHGSQLLVYRHPPASLFYTLLHPHQNFKIAKIFHFFQNIIVYTSFGTFKHQFTFIFQNIKLRTIGAKTTGGMIVDLPFMPFVRIIAFRENYFVVNSESGEMEINGYQWLINCITSMA